MARCQLDFTRSQWRGQLAASPSSLCPSWPFRKAQKKCLSAIHSQRHIFARHGMARSHADTDKVSSLMSDPRHGPQACYAAALTAKSHQQKGVTCRFASRQTASSRSGTHWSLGYKRQPIRPQSEKGPLQDVGRSTREHLKHLKRSNRFRERQRLLIPSDCMAPARGLTKGFQSLATSTF